MRFYDFTQGALWVIDAAPKVAKQLGHRQIMPIHLVIAMALENNTFGGKVLSLFGVDANRLVEIASEKIGGEGTEDLSVLSYSAKFKSVIERARKEAQALGVGYVGTEHLLLAALAEDDITADVLAEFGIDYDTLRQFIYRIYAGESPEIAMKEVMRSSSW